MNNIIINPTLREGIGLTCDASAFLAGCVATLMISELALRVLAYACHSFKPEEYRVVKNLKDFIVAVGLRPYGILSVPFNASGRYITEQSGEVIANYFYDTKLLMVAAVVLVIFASFSYDAADTFYN